MREEKKNPKVLKSINKVPRGCMCKSYELEALKHMDSRSFTKKKISEIRTCCYKYLLRVGIAKCLLVYLLTPRHSCISFEKIFLNSNSNRGRLLLLVWGK